MELSEYQALALQTDQAASLETDERVIPMLGLAGEVGELLSEFKKHLRDGEAHQLHPARVREELGDILWYVAAVGDRYGLRLEDIAESNLAKCAETWSGRKAAPAPATPRFDLTFPQGEQFPDRLVVHFEEVLEHGELRVRATWSGGQMGQTLSDNAHQDDGYRFHDVFHLGLVAGLGWSPVSRRNLGLKRRSVPAIDEVEDGGRAIVIEEGITALAFAYAVEHDWLRGVQGVDHDWLRWIIKITSHLEVSECSLAEWEATILMTCPVWKAVSDQRGGSVEVDLQSRRLRIVD